MAAKKSVKVTLPDFTVKPRMSGLGEVIVDVLADGEVIGSARAATEQSLYTGLHTVAPGLGEALRAAFLLGVSYSGSPPTQPSGPPAPPDEAAQ